MAGSRPFNPLNVAQLGQLEGNKDKNLKFRSLPTNLHIHIFRLKKPLLVNELSLEKRSHCRFYNYL